MKVDYETNNFYSSYNHWEPFSRSIIGPAMYKAIVTLNEDLQDTYLDMRQWGKGCAFINGFNLGRYWHVGPTRTLYIPAPLLKQGDNEVSRYL